MDGNIEDLTGGHTEGELEQDVLYVWHPDKEPDVSAAVVNDVKAVFDAIPDSPAGKQLTQKSCPFHEYMNGLRDKGVEVNSPVDLFKVIPEADTDEGIRQIIEINGGFMLPKKMAIAAGDEVDFFAVICSNMMEVYVCKRRKDNKLFVLRTLSTKKCSAENFTELDERTLREAQFFEEMDGLVVDGKKRFWPEFFGSGITEHPQTSKKVNFSYLEFVPGINLAELSEEFPEITSRPEFVLAVAMQVAQMLEDLYELGYVIRDLKLENIMLVLSKNGEPSVRFVDANIIYKPGSNLTGERHVLGSPVTMAPEQVQNFQIDQRTDLYALGIIMYAMLQKNFPFDGTVKGIMNAHVSIQPPPIEGISPQLWNLVSAFLKKDPKDRVPSGAIARHLLVDYFLSNYGDNEIAQHIGSALNLGT